MSDTIIQTTDASFDEDVVKSELPVLVDFWAPWCGPCKMIAPVLDLMAEEFDGKLKIVKVNVDENENTPAQFGVRGIPMLILFKSGEIVGTQVGAISAGDMKAWLEEQI